MSESDADAGTIRNTAVATGPGCPAGSTAAGCTTTIDTPVERSAIELRVSKTVTPYEVKIGDTVRYTVTIRNVGVTDAVDVTMVDSPPAGFTLVEGTLHVADHDAAGRLVGRNPIRVDQIDVAAGQSAVITYVLRVGAGVRPGSQVNAVRMQDNGKDASNIATATVQVVADPMVDETLVLGTVWDDRDADGWQDQADLSGVRVQGGFAAAAYVAGSTTVDRGSGAIAEPDASAPLLHGIEIGTIAGRASDADSPGKHRVVIRQTLRSPDFTDDFVLTSNEGVTVRMDAAGTTRVERDGDAAKGLDAAAPTVERRVSRTADGYAVDYIVTNAGVMERGIPGVRIASVEGLLIETDQFGRFHLAGMPGGSWERGRNVVLKVDPATLPPGSRFTTDNPLLRRVTPGLPVRFDFGVKLPPGEVRQQRAVEMELGTVMFDPQSAEIRGQYLPVIDRMAAEVRSHGAGEVVIQADGESQALAYERARRVKAALLEQVGPELAAALTVSLRTDLADPRSTLLSLGETPVLGTVLSIPTRRPSSRSSCRSSQEWPPISNGWAAAWSAWSGMRTHAARMPTTWRSACAAPRRYTRRSSPGWARRRRRNCGWKSARTPMRPSGSATSLR